MPAAGAIRAEIATVFGKRTGHPIPETPPAPPSEWKTPFEAGSPRTGLGPMSLDQAQMTDIGSGRNSVIRRTNATHSQEAQRTPHSQAQLSSTVKTARDIMRKDAGLNGDLDRIPQLSWVLFPEVLRRYGGSVGRSRRRVTGPRSMPPTAGATGQPIQMPAERASPFFSSSAVSCCHICEGYPAREGETRATSWRLSSRRPITECCPGICSGTSLISSTE